MISPSALGQINLRKPYAIFMGDVTDRASAKTGLGLRDWCRADVVGQIRTSDDAVDLGRPDMIVG